MINDFLNAEVLNRSLRAGFLNHEPYPWMPVDGLLRNEAYESLASSYPGIHLLEKSFGKERMYGQSSHDRFERAFDEEQEIPKDFPGVWRAFVDELKEGDYRKCLETIFGVRRFHMRFFWQVATSGCSVSPHCDSEKKHGSHIFYFNTAAEWNPSWGGQTLILSDGGRFRPASNPAFADLRVIAETTPFGNSSLLFKRTEHSWHGVRPLMCPEDHARKLFTVIAEKRPSIMERAISFAKTHVRH